MRKLYIFDFDATLMDTLDEDFGKKKYKEITGNDYPHKGWWGRKESLDFNMLPIKPNEWVVSIVKRSLEDSSTDTFLMTGRLEKLRTEINACLDNFGLNIFKEVYCNNSGKDTFTFKSNKIKELVDSGKYESLFFIDDRESHREGFDKLFEELSLTSKINITYVFINSDTEGNMTFNYNLFDIE